MDCTLHLYTDNVPYSTYSAFIKHTVKFICILIKCTIFYILCIHYTYCEVHLHTDQMYHILHTLHSLHILYSSSAYWSNVPCSTYSAFITHTVKFICILIKCTIFYILCIHDKYCKVHLYTWELYSRGYESRKSSKQ